MAKVFPTLFCRYEIAIHDEPLDPVEEFETLKDLVGKPVAHRKADPGPDDRDTFVMMPEQIKVDDHDVLTWCVGRQLSFREKASYDRDNDQVEEIAEETDECRYSRFVAIPLLGVLAVDDRSTEKSLGGRAAVSRMKSIIASVPGGKARIEYAGTQQDVETAMASWSLDKFDFTVRPFNPSPGRLSRELHDHMQADNIGKLRGTATPGTDETMADSNEGFLGAAREFSNAGYGQIGLKGHTPSGRMASIAKPKFSENRDKNLQHQQRSHTMKVYIPEQSNIKNEIKEMARSLVEFYG